MLVPDQTKPGFWRTEPATITGSHALIIGISDYPYLSGGSAPPAERAPDSGGLAQLEVSALSAALFFAWLNAQPTVAGASVASCRLLLAPRPAEKARVDALTGAHYAIADYEVVRTALKEWSDALAFGGRSAGPNVALFFFSGHGVEVAAAPAILARDIFDQKAADGGTNKALAIDPMTTAIKTYNIDRGLFFIDACRDAPKVARLLNIVGDEPLKANPAPQRRPDGVLRLQSTASGLRSYQAANDPGTIFTQAVMDGLDGPPPSYIPYDTTDLPWQLLFSALEGHAKRKVSELLKGHSPLPLQPVESYGNPYNAGILVAVKAGPEPDAGAPPALVTDTNEPELKIADAVQIGAASILENVRSLTTQDIEGIRRTRPDFHLNDLTRFDMMHAIFNHEGITDPWTSSLRFLDARTGEDAAPDIARIIAAHNQEIDGRSVSWIDLAIAPAPGGALWIGAGDLAQGSSASVTIPRDLNYPMPVRLDIAYADSPTGWTLSSISARLADPTDFYTYTPPAWRTLWEAQRTEAFADLASAGRSLEQLLDLQAVVDDKSESPIAAALAINYLLRANQLSYLRHWPQNLANWFEWLADGPVLWAETLLRRHEADPYDFSVGEIRDGYPVDALLFFSMLAERGAPLLSNSLAIALRQAALFRPLYEKGRIPGDLQFRLEQALGAVERAGAYLASGGSFVRFVAGEGIVSPEAILGARRRPQARKVAYA